MVQNLLNDSSRDLISLVGYDMSDDSLSELATGELLKRTVEALNSSTLSKEEGERYLETLERVIQESSKMIEVAKARIVAALYIISEGALYRFLPGPDGKPYRSFYDYIRDNEKRLGLGGKSTIYSRIGLVRVLLKSTEVTIDQIAEGKVDLDAAKIALGAFEYDHTTGEIKKLKDGYMVPSTAMVGRSLDPPSVFEVVLNDVSALPSDSERRAYIQDLIVASRISYRVMRMRDGTLRIFYSINDGKWISVEEVAPPDYVFDDLRKRLFQPTLYQSKS